jgi:hypothetical protein
MAKGNPEKSDKATGDRNSVAPNQEIVAAINSLGEKYEASQKDRPEHDKETLKWAKRAGIGVGIYTLLTLGIVLIGYCALRTAQDQVIISRDTEQRDLRAYVFLDTQAVLYPPGDAANRYAISLKVSNSGKTWARRLVIDKQVISPTMSEPFDALTKIRHPTFEPIVLGPGQNLSLQFGEILLSELAEIANGRKTYDYVAWVRYEDVLNDPPIQWQTQLSQRLNADTEGKGHVSFSYRTTHNCADRDCPER